MSTSPQSGYQHVNRFNAYVIQSSAEAAAKELAANKNTSYYVVLRADGWYGTRAGDEPTIDGATTVCFYDPQGDRHLPPSTWRPMVLGDPADTAKMVGILAASVTNQSLYPAGLMLTKTPGIHFFNSAIPEPLVATQLHSYHDVHLTTKEFARRRIADMAYEYELSCTRVAGWQLWFREDPADRSKDRLVGGEYETDKFLVIDIEGHIILDSRKKVRDEPGA